ncbi:NLR family CARD domain-containing protein 3-like isoform X1 [Hoplias malabaricus]|uniref:NLR family CARD domain-containing protein 3-like isoform X1 n=1 Tax=Hoplias malabaricus TaxID=27720 RepID=UPI003462DDB9
MTTESIITAQTAATVYAPQINRNIVEGSLSVKISNYYGGQEGPSSITNRHSLAITEEFISKCKQTHKTELEKKFKSLNEGILQHGKSALLNKIYTELYITADGSGDVNNEHEVRQIEKTSSRQQIQEMSIKCNDIFKPLPEQNKQIRTVLTRGVAGIGKTVSVQKFILDWAEGNVNQDITIIFPLPFRELNLIKKELSLVKLLHDFFQNLKQFKLKDLIESTDYTVMFIFDGLDEYRHSLDFKDNESWFDVEEPTTVDVLLTNLIKGNLLPSALLWITTRPAAANQIPPECIDQVTDVRGFNDPQKDEYFKIRISDESLAEKIITHMKSSRSLYIMCHIPVFCWIASTVLEKMFGEVESEEIPRTLTQMFTHFLKYHIKYNIQKYSRQDLDRRIYIQALGKLAFKQLKNGKIIFYKEDLKKCDIAVNEIAVYSGVCTQIFRTESVLELEKVYSFVHLSVQEFLAALYKFLSFISSQRNQLNNRFCAFFRKPQISSLLIHAVDKALKSKNGHLDLYLRFLLGLSLESNQILLRGLLPQTASYSHNKEEIVKYIKKKIKENLSPEKSINLFHCLNELQDQALEQEVQTYLKGNDSSLSETKLSSVQWSALAFVLLNSEKDLDEFDLNKYDTSDECLLRLLPVVKASRKFVIHDWDITEKSCATLASALRSPSSSLKELKLSNSNLQGSRLKLLSAGLENLQCKLETLRLTECSVTEEGCAALVKALKSNPSHLRELNLSHNQLQDSGAMKLPDLLSDPQCHMEKLLLEQCCITGKGCDALVQALKSNPSHLRELNLNVNKILDFGAKALSDLLQDPQFKLEKLLLCDCGIKEEGCASVVEALKSNLPYLRELNLNASVLGESGVKHLSELLRDPQCKLEKLLLYECVNTEEGCADLLKALKLNPSHLKELNLNWNELRKSGVKQLCSLLEDLQCKLEKLWLEGCSITDDDCIALVKALKSNPSHMRELILNYNKAGDIGIKNMSGLLEDAHCKLEKLMLDECGITKEGCAALVKALKSNPSHLRDLSLGRNDLGNSGVKELCDLLRDSHCKLEKLLLWSCNITEEICEILVSALRSNSSNLRELDLSNNELSESGKELLSAALEDPTCKLKKLNGVID